MSTKNSSSSVINNDENDPHRKSGEGIRKRKEFIARNSLLTDLYKINHFNSIRHLCIAILILLAVQTILSGITESGRFFSMKHGLHYIFSGCRQFYRTAIIWITMFSSVLILYPAFCFWANHRETLSPKSVLYWDHLCLTSFLMYFTLFFCLPPYYLLQQDLIMISSTVVIGTQVCMLIKVHVYVRTNVPKVTSYKKDMRKFFEEATFSNYVYYLFAPTLIYRDQYARNKNIRWSFVATSFLEVATMIFLLNSLVTTRISPTLKSFHSRTLNWVTVLSCVFDTILPSFVIGLAIFYSVMHAWVNLWAEILRFADRLFYLDWWNSTTYAEFYRRINVVVYDYLHTYIYRDLHEIVLPGNKVFASCGAIFISAIMHEYIMGLVLGIFMPVMLVMYSGFGTVFAFFNVRSQLWGNLFFWLTLSFGLGVQCTLYSIEYHASFNCPKNIVSFRDYFIPHIFYCY